jgi:nucleoside-diphosphate-sugar epimerase
VKRVLVTGATGFVGRWALDELLARDFEVHACAARELPGGAGPVRWHRADLLAAGVASSLVTAVRPSHLLHLAWYAAHGRFWQAPENLGFVRASLELLQAFRESGGTRATVAGTCAEYDWAQGTCVEGATPLAPRTLYGTAKDALRRLLEAYARESGLSWSWGRLFHLYGPQEDPRRLVASVITAMLAGQEAPCSHGRQLRDFMFVADVAAALVALLDSAVEGPVNIATGVPTSIRELVGAIGELLGTSHLARFDALATPEGDPPTLVADTRRLRDEVGFVPRTDLRSGLEQTIRWWRQAWPPERR